MSAPTPLNVLELTEQTRTDCLPLRHYSQNQLESSFASVHRSSYHTQLVCLHCKRSLHKCLMYCWRSFW